MDMQTQTKTKEEKRAANAKRQREFRARKVKQDGLVSVTAFVPEHLAADVRDMLRLLCENPELELGPFRNTKTGVLIGKLKAGRKLKAVA